MPLVIFNYNESLDGSMKTNGFSQSLEIPRYGHDKHWKLVAINAQYMNNAKEDFRILEVDLPELLTAQNVLYSTKALGDVDIPSNTLRFYVNTYELSESNDDFYSNLTEYSRKDSVFKAVSLYPNMNLGVHRLENTVLTVNVKALNGNMLAGPTYLSAFSIILEYEE